MTRLSWSVVVAALLTACAAPAGTAPSDPATSASATAPPSSVATAGASEDVAEPDTLFGTFDLDEYNELFDGDASTATVEGGRIRYVYEIGEVNAEFMVDPNDKAKTILQSSFTASDILAEPLPSEAEAMETWFALTAESQPDAAAWIREKLDDYLAAPGAEMTLNEAFGDARAGFFTLQPFSFDDPDPLRPASLVGFYVEDIRALD